MAKPIVKILQQLTAKLSFCQSRLISPIVTHIVSSKQDSKRNRSGVPQKRLSFILLQNRATRSIQKYLSSIERINVINSDVRKIYTKKKHEPMFSIMYMYSYPVDWKLRLKAPFSGNSKMAHIASIGMISNVATQIMKFIRKLAFAGN